MQLQNDTMSTSQQIKANPQGEWLSGAYSFDQLGEVSTLNVHHPKAECSIALQGAQILSFCPQDGKERLWLSQSAVFDGKTAIRGGIPICWPWFGNRGKPSHGFARISNWEVLRLTSNEKQAMVELGLQDSEQTKQLFPYQFQLRLTVVISETLDIKLAITNKDQRPFTFTGALHSYFAVSEVSDTQVIGLAQRCLNSVDNGKEIAVNTPLTFSHALDYVFSNQGQLEVRSGHNMKLSSQGADSWVIWNPWAEGAELMTDMDGNDYHNMLCIEPAVFKTSPELQTGQTYILSLNIE